jgi:UDP-3-O-[3-hydroxymyristoyl] glucosamine N-acyltransferase
LEAQLGRISPKAQIGAGAQIAETAIIHDNVSIGVNCRIGEYCIIGHPASGPYEGRLLRIGDGAIIRSHTVVYEGSTFGPDLAIGHSSLIRAGVTAGTNLQIGSFNDIEGECDIGNWTRFHSNVHLSRGSWVGDLVWIFPYAVTTNDPIPPSGLKVGVTVEDAAVICTSAIVLPGAVVGLGAFVGAMSRAGGKIPPAALIVGNPGKIVGSIRKLRYAPTGQQHPWMSHHANAYPKAAQAKLGDLLTKLESACDQLEAELARTAKN